MLKYLVTEHKLIWTLAKNDFKTKFAGSYLGIVWALVQPIVTVLVYWFVFQVGLRQTADFNGCPFCVVDAGRPGSLVLFSRGHGGGGTNVLMEYSYLVKKGGL